MSNLTLPFMLHPKYSNWQPSQDGKSTGPQQYPYSETETTSTNEDTAEFLQYRKYRYVGAYSNSVSAPDRKSHAHNPDNENSRIEGSGCAEWGDDQHPWGPNDKYLSRPTASEGVSTRGTPSSPPGSSTGRESGPFEGSHDQNLGGLESRLSSSNSVSVPGNVPDKSRNTNTGLRDASDASVQVGVEIEFLVALEMEHNVGPPQEKPVEDRYFIPLEQQEVTTKVDGIPARRHISQLLRNSGIPAVSDHNQRDEVRQAAACFEGPLNEEDEYAFWAVKCEPAGMVMGLDAEIFDYVGLELASRKLQANVQGFKEIRSVLHILRRHVLVATSTSCGVHVHVDAATLTLQQRKHFLCLYLLAEKELFSLTAPHRRGVNTWCGPVVEKTSLAEDAEDILKEAGADDGEDGQPPSALKMNTMKALIQECTSTEDLQKALSRNKLPPFHRAALNLKEVGEQIYTFEFRHFQASLDPEVIEHFVRLCVALVMSAKGLGDAERPSFDEMYEAFDQIKEWRDLLTTIGLQGAISYWEALLWTYPAATEGSPSESSRMKEDARPSSFLPPLD
ncbi:hypothetical protein LA080_014721 [Diaporthe eres]|nr:hypothetical protein LA080_014721 [Diaporthe eres]